MFIATTLFSHNGMVHAIPPPPPFSMLFSFATQCFTNFECINFYYFVKFGLLNSRLLQFSGGGGELISKFSRGDALYRQPCTSNR